MKNEELNLAELLKDCPKGTKFYSPMFGYVFLSAVKTNKIEIIIQDDDKVKTTTSVKVNGYFNNNFSDGECMLFPSKDQRDWNVWKAEQDKKQENPFKVGDYVIDKRDNTLNIITRVIDKDNVEVRFIDSITSIHLTTDNLTKIDKYPISRFLPFDRVLCRYSDKDKWKAHFFSHIDTGNRDYPFYATFSFRHCIPYNSETEHLVGSTDKAPEFYINWEE